MLIGVMDMTVNHGEISEVVAAVGKAAALGAGSFWAPNFFGLDGLTALAVAGVQVPQIALGVAVVPIFGRHPRVLAQQARTVHAATESRLTLGVGLSHRPLVDGVVAAWPRSPIDYLADYLDQLVPLCRVTSSPLEGGPTTLRVPTGKPLCVLAAALGPKAVAVAGSRCDGVVLWCVGPITVAELTVPTLRSAAATAGRTCPQVVVAVPLCVTDDPAAARDRVNRRFGGFDSLPSYQAALAREGAGSIGDLAIVGDRDDVLAGIDRYRSAGATQFLWTDVASGDRDRAATRDLMGELMSAV